MSFEFTTFVFKIWWTSISRKSIDELFQKFGFWVNSKTTRSLKKKSLRDFLFELFRRSNYFPIAKIQCVFSYHAFCALKPVLKCAVIKYWKYRTIRLELDYSSKILILRFSIQERRNLMSKFCIRLWFSRTIKWAKNNR